MLQNFFLSLIKIYQFIFSPDQGIFSYFSVRVCRFCPSCSQYTYQAVKKYGVLKGVFKGVKRILRCHPFNEGGFDPVV